MWHASGPVDLIHVIGPHNSTGWASLVQFVVLYLIFYLALAPHTKRPAWLKQPWNWHGNNCVSWLKQLLLRG